MPFSLVTSPRAASNTRRDSFRRLEIGGLLHQLIFPAILRNSGEALRILQYMQIYALDEGLFLAYPPAFKRAHH